MRESIAFAAVARVVVVVDDDDDDCCCVLPDVPVDDDVDGVRDDDDGGGGDDVGAVAVVAEHMYGVPVRVQVQQLVLYHLQHPIESHPLLKWMLVIC